MQLLLGLGDTVPEALINYQPRGDSPILQRLIQLIRIRNRHTLVEFAVLDQRRRFGAVDVGNWRCLAIDGQVVPRRRLQVLARERVDIGAYVVGHPIGDSGAYRDGAKAIAVAGDECGNVTALAPAHRAHAVAVDEPLADQIIHAGDHIVVVA